MAAEESLTGVIPLPADIPTDIPMAVVMDSPVPEPETHLDPDADSILDMTEAGSTLEPAEDELVLSETETETTIVLEEEEAEPAAESEPFWPPQAAEEPEAEIAPAPEFTETVVEVATEALIGGTNGVASHGTGGPKSLEDSIKEMLRPMLRDWLNENMPRMIREELDSDALQRGQD